MGFSFALIFGLRSLVIHCPLNFIQRTPHHDSDIEYIKKAILDLEDTIPSQLRAFLTKVVLLITPLSRCEIMG
jgi:hypothetical protein